MRTLMFDIRKSKKSYIESVEHYIVVKDGTVFLRILGEEPNYQVMTATAGEDQGNIAAFGNQSALIEAALRVSANLNIPPKVKNDYNGKEYVEICRCEFLSDAYRAAEMLFENLEEYRESRSENDMRNIYSDLAIDESGEDIYLSDGMWLSSDGTVKDLGR
jgi:hypothetical protein